MAPVGSLATHRPPSGTPGFGVAGPGSSGSGAGGWGSVGIGTGRGTVVTGPPSVPGMVGSVGSSWEGEAAERKGTGAVTD
jgi:hypothetical protein